MIPLPSPTKIVKKQKNHAIFEIEGLYPGYGVTVGNALRRVILSSLEGVAVTQVRIKGAAHEFSTIPGVLEDVMLILLNLKNLRFKIHEGATQKVELQVKGEKKVTGADFALSSQVELANPELHIATITDKKAELHIELTIEKGIGYSPKDSRKVQKTEIGNIAMDAIYTPIKNVNFQVENMRVGERTDFDKLQLEIETDGTITPEEAFHESCEILIRHFTLILGEKTEEPQEAAAQESSESESEEKPKKTVKKAAKKSKK